MNTKKKKSHHNKTNQPKTDTQVSIKTGSRKLSYKKNPSPKDSQAEPKGTKSEENAKWQAKENEKDKKEKTK